ncbi:MAG: Rod shape-determining protein MreD [Cyclobacteriaceae bacterium]|jgi:rod shape-determining protein MreD|nr:Rod shape-determining protein MreD [Cyclobacteriaceae bacterium]
MNVYRVIGFFFFLLLQVLVFRHVVLFHTAFCFIYLLFLLTQPVETNPLLNMLIAFAMGLLIDMFYDSAGLHAMASVAMMYLRGYWLNRITPQGGYERNANPTIAANGVQWFLVYIIPLLIIHNLVLFFVEAGGFGYFWFTLLKVITSVLLTTFILVLYQLFFSRK